MKCSGRRRFMRWFCISEDITYNILLYSYFRCVVPGGASFSGDLCC